MKFCLSELFLIVWIRTRNTDPDSYSENGSYLNSSVLNLQVLIKRIYNIQCLQGRWNSLVCSTVIINFRKAWIRICTEKNMLDSDPHHCSSRNIFRKDSYPLHVMSLLHSVAEPEPVEPKFFGDLEPEPKINLNKYFLQSVWRMLRRRKAHFYLYYYSTTVVEQF